MEEINNFQQEPDESLFRAWERFKELLMKCPQHYLTDMQEVILFYNELFVPTRQILDSKGAIPTKTAADAKVAIQEMTEFSQKWHNGTSSKTRNTENSDGLAAIQAQLNSLEREIKKVNEKVYAAQVRCELCKGPHYTKDCPSRQCVNSHVCNAASRSRDSGTRIRHAVASRIRWRSINRRLSRGLQGLDDLDARVHSVRERATLYLWRRAVGYGRGVQILLTPVGSVCGGGAHGFSVVGGADARRFYTSEGRSGSALEASFRDRHLVVIGEDYLRVERI
ncbi:hypothetical protein Tco_1008467 [Tanacetum coccineum]